MKKLARAAIALLLCLTAACSVITKPPRVVHVVPQISMTIHADTAFTLHERALIVLAAQRMKEQTNDFVNVDVLFDLDFDSMESLKEHSKHNIMTRIDSSAPGLEDSPMAKTIGYCIVNFNDLDFNNPIKIALVHDRLITDDAWVHVAMHEMLHALRQQHIAEPKSIMYKSTPVAGSTIVTCLVRKDMEEICEVHGCDDAAMKPCEP